MTRRSDEGGFAVVAAAGLSVLLVLVALIGVGVGALFGGHRRAAAAADLAALAGAGAQQRGADACAAAEKIAAANGVELVGCRPADASVEITVRIEVGGLLGGTELRARSRAGLSESGVEARLTG